MRYVGVDITGANRDWDWILIDDDYGAPWHRRGGHDDLLAFLRDRRPNVVAIDAPSKRNCGLMRQAHVRRDVLGERLAERTKAGRLVYEDCRVSEAELGVRHIKSYFTSGTRSPPDWVGAGLRLYEDLAALGYMTWDEPGPVSTLGSGIDQVAIETYPHACFVVRLGWIPQLKTSLAGCLERIACLKAWGDELRVELGASEGILQEIGALRWEHILEHGAPRSLSHDKLDALAAALTAKLVAQNPAVAYAVGRKADGVIVLPGRPLGAYHAH